MTSFNHLMVVAAGTGGHVLPAITIGKHAGRQGIKVSFCTTKRGAQNWSFPATFNVHLFNFSAFRNQSIVHQIKIIVQVIWVTGQSIIHLMKQRPDAVLAMGGYLSVPVGLAAFICRVPLFIHEQNAVIGLANRLLSPLSNHRFCAYDQVFKRPYTLVGNPIDEKICSILPWKPPLGARKLRLLIIGGSQGAVFVNQLVINTLKQNGLKAFDVWHQTGQSDYKKVEQEVSKYKDCQYQVVPFIQDMAQAYQWGDVVMSRAGALSIAEIMHVGRYSLLIPLAGSVDNHQLKNALAFKDQHCGDIWQEAACSPERLSQWLGQCTLAILSKQKKEVLNAPHLSADHFLNQIIHYSVK